MTFTFSPKAYYTLKNVNDFIIFILANKGSTVQIIHRGSTKSIEYKQENTILCEWSATVGQKVRLKPTYCSLHKSEKSKITSLVICKLWLKYRKPVYYDSTTCSSGNCVGKFLTYFKKEWSQFFTGEVQSQMQSQAQSDMQSQAQSQAQSDMQSQAQNQVQSDMQSQAQNQVPKQLDEEKFLQALRKIVKSVYDESDHVKYKEFVNKYVKEQEISLKVIDLMENIQKDLKEQKYQNEQMKSLHKSKMKEILSSQESLRNFLSSLQDQYSESFQTQSILINKILRIIQAFDTNRTITNTKILKELQTFVANVDEGANNRMKDEINELKSELQKVSSSCCNTENVELMNKILEALTKQTFLRQDGNKDDKKQASTQQASTQQASTQQASTQQASTQQTSTQQTSSSFDIQDLVPFAILKLP